MPLYKLMIKTHRVTGRQYVSFTARKDRAALKEGWARKREASL